MKIFSDLPLWVGVLLLVLLLGLAGWTFYELVWSL